MYPRCLLIFIICLTGWNTSLYCQNQLAGLIYDETKSPLYGATVVVLDHVDSTMLAFGISDYEGKFEIEDVPTGACILQISFVSYSTITQRIDVKEKKVALGTFQLSSQSELLQEVTIKAEHIPMGILGDTINYNAAAFNVRPGATVEELLRKMPGIEVQRDGSIKAMGKEVENVLVDGKAFFGDDPKIATQNLEAEAIDKVQVYDKKSELAEFTGIDDGVEEKTINLKLKEEYKNGGFGKMAMEGGTADRYNGKLNYNRFSPSMQAALIVSANNINKQAFSFNDYISFMGGLANAISSNNGIVSFGDQTQSPQGISDDLSSGINFNLELNEKLKFDSYYFYLNKRQQLNVTSNSAQFLPNGTFSSQDSTQSDKNNQHHNLNFKLYYKPSASTQLNWKNQLRGSFGNQDREINTSLFQNNSLINQSSSLFNNMSDQLAYEGSFEYRKKYSKKGRNWMSDINYKIGNILNDDIVVNQYLFENGSDFINQHQDYRYQKNMYAINSAFIEPLGNEYYLTASYTYNAEREKPRKLFYNIIDSNNESLDRAISGNFKKTNSIHSSSIFLKKSKKSFNAKLGLGFQHSTIYADVLSILGDDLEKRISHLSSFLLPSFSLDIDTKKTQSLTFQYATAIGLPSLQQLAPLPDNSNPNYTITGNTDLQPEYTHRLNIGFNSINQFHFRSFFLNTIVAYTQDKIINEITVNDRLQKNVQPVNTSDYKSITTYAAYAAPLNFLKLKYRINGNLSFADYLTNLNSTISNVKETHFNLGVVLENKNKEVFDVASGMRVNYNVRRYELNPTFNQSFFNYSLYSDIGLSFSNQWFFNCTYDYNRFSGELFATSQSFHLLHTSLRYSLTGEKLSLTVSAHDLLNQNRGINRSGSATGLYEERFNTLGRYVLFGASIRLGRGKKGSLPL